MPLQERNKMTCELCTGKGLISATEICGRCDGAGQVPESIPQEEPKKIPVKKSKK